LGSNQTAPVKSFLCSKQRRREFDKMSNLRHARDCGLLYLASDTFVSRFTLSQCQ
jgi:hypothetical protein